MNAILNARIKFVAITTGIVTMVVVIFCTAILVSSRIRSDTDAYRNLQRIATSVPIMSDAPIEIRINGERINDFRSFVALLDENDNVMNALFTSEFFDRDSIEEICASILAENKEKGITQDLIYYVSREGGKTKIAVQDYSFENSLFNWLVLSVVFSGLAGVAVLFLLTWLLSYWAVKPIGESFKKQKEFISNAGHELKTPVTIISAGAELIKKQIENTDVDENVFRWLDNIVFQAAKMTETTSNLVKLTRLDEQKIIAPKEFIDISSAVLRSALGFESLAYENKKTLVLNVEPNILVAVDEKSIMECVDILCDNAIKYSGENSIITVSLETKNDENSLCVSNTQSSLKDGEEDMIFERFYRGDSSRSNTSGDGLGLAILKAHCESNNWKLSLKNESDTLIFKIVF